MPWWPLNNMKIRFSLWMVEQELGESDVRRTLCEYQCSGQTRLPIQVDPCRRNLVHQPGQCRQVKGRPERS